jgi:hypothetical protein
MLLGHRALTIWTVINLAAAALFTYLASWTWLEPNLRGEEVARGGDALVWAVAAFPVLAVALIADIAWLVLVARERARQRAPWPYPFIVIIAATWIAALVVDRLRF